MSESVPYTTLFGVANPIVRRPERRRRQRFRPPSARLERLCSGLRPDLTRRLIPEFDPHPATSCFAAATSLLKEIGAPVVTWVGSTPWSRGDALSRLLHHISAGGTYTAKRPGEFAYSTDAADRPKRRWQYPTILGSALAVRYLYFPHNPRSSAIAAFDAATVGEADAVRALELRLDEIIVLAERQEIGAVKIAGRWFFSRSSVLRKAGPWGMILLGRPSL